MRAFASISLVFASLQTPAFAAADEFRAHAFADAVWEYVELRCPDASQISEDVNAAIKNTLAMPFSYGETELVLKAEVASKNMLAETLTNRGKHGFALMVVGAHAVVQQLSFTSALVDGTFGSDEANSSVPSRQEIEASVSLMECVMPEPVDVRGFEQSTEFVDAEPFDVFAPVDLTGESYWYQVSKTLLSGNCDLEMTVLTRRYMDAPFAGRSLEERQALNQEILAAHSAFLEEKQANNPCEDFS